LRSLGNTESSPNRDKHPVSMRLVAVQAVTMSPGHASQRRVESRADRGFSDAISGYGTSATSQGDPVMSASRGEAVVSQTSVEVRA